MGLGNPSKLAVGDSLIISNMKLRSQTINLLRDGRWGTLRDQMRPVNYHIGRKKQQLKNDLKPGK